MTVAPNPNGNDSIYITDGYTTLATTNTVEVQDGCTLTLEPNVQLVVCAGANLIIDGGSQVIKEAGSSIDVEPGGTLTGIGSGGGNPNAPPQPTGFSVNIVGQNVVLKWNPQIPLNNLTYSVSKASNGSVSVITPSNYTSTSFTDSGAAASLPDENVADAYWVTATNSYGSSSTEPVSVGTAPTNVNSGLWSGVVYVNSAVTVPSDFPLTIEPGTRVVFNTGGGYGITANSPLSVDGSSSSPVVFTSNSASPSPGDWGSIVLNGSGANGSTIDYADIDYGTQVDVENASNVEITNCNITANSGHGIYYYNSSGSVLNNTISNSNVNHGIYVLSSTVTCDGNVIYKINQNQQGAGIQYSGSSGYIWRNDVDYYNWGIAAIWGSSPL